MSHPASGGQLRRILMVAPYFAPHPRVGALRAFRLATHLPDLGYLPTVVHLAASGLQPTPFERQRLARVETLALRLPLGVHAVPTARAATSGSNQSPQGGAEGCHQWRTELRRVLKHGRRALDAHVPIDGWLPVLAAHSLGLLRRFRAGHFDLLWSTADPWSSHLLAGVLSRYLDCPWVADFRDPWSLCSVRTRDRAAWARKLDARAERWVLERAARVTFTASATQRQYAGAYPTLQEKFATFENGFDPASCRLQSASNAAPGQPQGRFRALFLGRFRALSSLHRWLPVLRSLPADQARQLTLAAVGPLAPADATRLALACPGIEYEALEAVPHEALGGLLHRADLLLLSTSPGREQIIPAKLWDYLPARAPILSICENSEIAQVLARTRRGQQLTLSEAGRFISKSIAHWQRGGSGTQPTPDWTEIARFSAPEQTAHWARLFDALVGEKAPPPG